MSKNIMIVDGNRYYSEDYLVESMVRHACHFKRDFKTVSENEAESRTVLTFENFLGLTMSNNEMRCKFQRKYVQKRFLDE